MPIQLSIAISHMFCVDLKALAVGTEIQMLSFKLKPRFVVLVVLDYGLKMSPRKNLKESTALLLWNVALDSRFLNTCVWQCC